VHVGKFGFLQRLVGFLISFLLIFDPRLPFKWKCIDGFTKHFTCLFYEKKMLSIWFLIPMVGSICLPYWATVQQFIVSHFIPVLWGWRIWNFGLRSLLPWQLRHQKLLFSQMLRFSGSFSNNKKLWRIFKNSIVFVELKILNLINYSTDMSPSCQVTMVYGYGLKFYLTNFY
jgi:hypothetical protein